MIIGQKERFGFEVLSEDLTGELAEIFIDVAGKRVSGRTPVFIPTFVGELMGFMKSHQSEPPTTFDFSRFNSEEAFNLLREITETDKGIECLTPNAVWDYHRLHSIDDAVDDWEIYVFDVGEQKHIVCRQRQSGSGSSEKPGQIFWAVLPRMEFIHTLEEFLKLFSP